MFLLERVTFLTFVLVNKPELMLRSNVREGLANSDHDSIEFALKVKIVRRKCSPRLVYDYKNADWDGLKEDFRNIHGYVLTWYRILRLFGVRGRVCFSKLLNVISLPNSFRLSGMSLGLTRTLRN